MPGLSETAKTISAKERSITALATLQLRPEAPRTDEECPGDWRADGDTGCADGQDLSQEKERGGKLGYYIQQPASVRADVIQGPIVGHRTSLNNVHSPRGYLARRPPQEEALRSQRSLVPPSPWAMASRPSPRRLYPQPA